MFCFRNFCLKLKWQISFIGRCRKSGNHPSYEEGLAEFGNKPEIKWKSFSHPSTYLATQWKPHKRIWWLHLCSSFTPKNSKIHISSSTLTRKMNWWSGWVYGPISSSTRKCELVIWLHRTETDPKSATCKHWFAPTIWSLSSSSWITNSLQQSRFKGQFITKKKLFLCKLRNGLCLNSSRNLIVEAYDRPGLWTTLQCTMVC